jgi:hypothetical protein
MLKADLLFRQCGRIRIPNFRFNQFTVLNLLEPFHNDSFARFDAAFDYPRSIELVSYLNGSDLGFVIRSDDS